MAKRIICLCLVMCLMAAMPMQTQAAGNAKIEDYAKQLIQYYYHHQDAAEDVIWDILRQMEEVDRHQAAVWRNIMADWAWVNNGMPVGEGVLPDGLPEDESLCIVVLGYGLAEDGSMKPELVDRLVVALASALKYPRASVAVSGGQRNGLLGYPANWAVSGITSRTFVSNRKNSVGNSVFIFFLNSGKSATKSYFRPVRRFSSYTIFCKNCVFSA